MSPWQFRSDSVDVPIGIQNAPIYLGIGLSAAGLTALAKQHPRVSILKIEDEPLAIQIGIRRCANRHPKRAHISGHRSERCWTDCTCQTASPREHPQDRG